MPFDICWLSGNCAENRDTLTYRFHNHTFFELHFITKGYVTYGFETENIRVGEGNYIIVSPRCTHKVAWHSEDFGKFTLAFEIPSDSETYSLFDSASGVAHGISGAVESCFAHVIETAEQKGAYRAERVRFALCELLFAVAETMGVGSFLKTREETNDDRIIKAKKYVEDNFDIFFTCEEVAGYCHISVKQLGRLFKKYENIGLLEFIHKKKLESAVKLLCETELSQKQIADKLGFSDVRYFGRFVLRMTGMTPAKLKENNKQELSR